MSLHPLQKALCISHDSLEENMKHCWPVFPAILGCEGLDWCSPAISSDTGCLPKRGRQGGGGTTCTHPSSCCRSTARSRKGGGPACLPGCFRKWSYLVGLQAANNVAPPCQDWPKESGSYSIQSKHLAVNAAAPALINSLVASQEAYGSPLALSCLPRFLCCGDGEFAVLPLPPTAARPLVSLAQNLDTCSLSQAAGGLAVSRPDLQRYCSSKQESLCSSKKRSSLSGTIPSLEPTQGMQEILRGFLGRLWSFRIPCRSPGRPGHVNQIPRLKASWNERLLLFISRKGQQTHPSYPKKCNYKEEHSQSLRQIKHTGS